MMLSYEFVFPIGNQLELQSEFPSRMYQVCFSFCALGAFWRRKWELGQANSFGIGERLGLSAQRGSSWDVVMDVIISPTDGV